MFGTASGSGVYWNYVFTAVWGVDVLWWWIAPFKYEARAKWITYAIHGFLAFMFFNAAIVFGSPFMRIFGVLLMAMVLFGRFRYKTSTMMHLR